MIIIFQGAIFQTYHLQSLGVHFSDNHFLIKNLNILTVL